MSSYWFKGTEACGGLLPWPRVSTVIRVSFLVCGELFIPVVAVSTLTVVQVELS